MLLISLLEHFGQRYANKEDGEKLFGILKHEIVNGVRLLNSMDVNLLNAIKKIHKDPYPASDSMREAAIDKMCELVIKLASLIGKENEMKAFMESAFELADDFSMTRDVAGSESSIGEDPEQQLRRVVAEIQAELKKRDS